MHEPNQKPGPARRRERRRVLTPIGASPGTLQAPPASAPGALTAICYGPSHFEPARRVSVAELAELRHRAPVVWIDVTGFGDVATLRAVGDGFGLHRLSLEDVLNLQQRAKVEDFGDHLFLVLRMVDPTDADETEQLGLFVGPGFVLTFQERPGDCFGLVRQRLQDPGGRLRRHGSDYLAYALLDAVVDAYFPVVEDLDERLERVEQGVLGGQLGAAAVPELHALRRRLLVLRRAIWPLREATSSLARGEAKHFSAQVHPYLRDVHDHVVQLLDLLESCRELASSLMDLHLSTLNHRLNEVMKLLTIISTIFIPLTFLVGIYGMNFDSMPELRQWWGYPACLLLIVVVAAGMLRWSRRRHWL
ncbi:MAG: magnesium/cobalt transporter CorA [Planctomycetes bacterium]|nr:magnesium/cobalt transporter CorA [Planctomycetota bacterium]